MKFTDSVPKFGNQTLVRKKVRTFLFGNQLDVAVCQYWVAYRDTGSSNFREL